MAFFNDWYIKLPDESTSQRLKSWGIATHVDAEIAAAKTSYQDIFGLNGAIDYSEFASGVKYQNRPIKMYLVIREEDIPSASGLTDTQDVCEAFARKYHGQRVEISRSIGVSTSQTYKGRLQITSDSKSKVIRLITCTMDADPFVYFDNGSEELTPIYRTESTLPLTAGTIIGSGGLTPFSIDDQGYTLFNSGDIGRFAVWNFPIVANKVVFPQIRGRASHFYVEFLDSDGTYLEFDGGGYRSTSTKNLKVKITARTRNMFRIRLDSISFEQIDHAVTEMRNIKNLKMPSDIFYTNQNEGAKLFLNGEYFSLDVTGIGKYELLTDAQMSPNQSNWIAVLAETAEDVSTATDVVINYDNRDLVGDADV